MPCSLLSFFMRSPSFESLSRDSDAVSFFTITSQCTVNGSYMQLQGSNHMGQILNESGHTMTKPLPQRWALQPGIERSQQSTRSFCFSTALVVQSCLANALKLRASFCNLFDLRCASGTHCQIGNNSHVFTHVFEPKSKEPCQEATMFCPW